VYRGARSQAEWETRCGGILERVVVFWGQRGGAVAMTIDRLREARYRPQESRSQGVEMGRSRPGVAARGVSVSGRFGSQ